MLDHIVYNKDIGNNTPGETLTVYSRIEYIDDESYVINGAMSDTISDFTGLLFSFLSTFIPTPGIISRIAVTIVSYYGGKVAGGAIGVAFTDEVSVRASHFTLTGYHASSNYYTAGYSGVRRLVKTKRSPAYNEWFNEGYTPDTWKDGDDLATILWMAVFARTFPYVYEYR